MECTNYMCVWSLFGDDVLKEASLDQIDPVGVRMRRDLGEEK